jgi:hypothetical protein
VLHGAFICGVVVLVGALFDAVVVLVVKIEALRVLGVIIDCSKSPDSLEKHMVEPEENQNRSGACDQTQKE